MRHFVLLINERALKVANTIHDSERELIGILQEMDQCKGYFDFDCESLWAYCKNILKISDFNASTMIGIARKSMIVPELKAAVLDGRVELSKARKIAPLLTKENQTHWLAQAETLSKRDLEKEIAEHSPKLATKESAKPVSRKRVQFGCGLDEEVFAQFKEIQDLVSQKTNKSADFEETLKAMIVFYKEKNDPLQKADRSKKRAAKSQTKSDVPVGENQSASLVRHSPGNVGRTQRTDQRRYPAKLRHQIILRDGRQCAHIDSTGKRCENKRWLQFHHKIHVKDGGNDTLENLQTLCWAHHKMTHEKGGVSDQFRTYDFCPRLSG